MAPPIEWMDARSLAGGAAGEGTAAEEEGDLQGGLNEPQRRAVTHPGGALLILAGAGSGKTRVITRRIAWLQATGRAAPHEVLAITFTNKAAREMRERVEVLGAAQGAWISTFHSMCARILRRDVEVLGSWTRDFSIWDTADRNDCLKRLIRDAGFDGQRFRPSAVGSWISDRKNRGRLGEETSMDASSAEGIEEEVLRRVMGAYEEAKREANALDFDDLLLVALELFDRHPGVRDAYASRFRHVLVDEYQDTNRVQYLLVRHLAGWHGNLAVCGDPDQSIYAWRGADVRNILDFERDFGPADVVKLEQNYRSTMNVLRCAQAVIRNNSERKEKDLWSEREDGPLVQALECANEDDEAREIAARISELLVKGKRADEIAVFYRANFMQRALERALRLAGIPYQIVAGVEFYQRREVRDLLAYLQLVVNPRDDVAFRRVVNVPPRAVGERSLQVLSAAAAERGIPLREAAALPEVRAAVRGRARAGLQAFAELMEQLDAFRDAPAAEALGEVIDATDYLEHLSQLAEPNLASRQENVEELRANARTYDRENPEGKLRGFLQDVALVSDADGLQDDVRRVVLMTLHSAKGLEFPVVFVAGLEDGLLPHSLALADGASQRGGEEEERRLFYVGMTRAMERLVLTHARVRLHYGEATMREPSRFLAEIPSDLLEGGPIAEDDGDVLGEYDPPPYGDELRIGDRVEHDHFGSGRVALLQGAGVNARATVDFDDVGRKVLLLQYARLRPAGGAS